jgi:hypothetical protein
MDINQKLGPTITRADEEDLPPTWLYWVRLFVSTIALVILVASLIGAAWTGVFIGAILLVGGQFVVKSVRRSLPRRYSVTVVCRRAGPYRFARVQGQLQPLSGSGMRIMAEEKNGRKGYRVTPASGSSEWYPEKAGIFRL